MSEISGVWHGIGEAAEQLAKMAEEMTIAAQHEGMHNCAEVVKQLGSANAPKHKGHLAGQWGTIIDRQGDTIRLQVGPNVPYARRNVIGYRGLKIRRARSSGKLRVGTLSGRGRNAQPPHRTWLLRTFEESATRFHGIISTAVNPARIKGGSYH
jgi:hypothetical protein